MDYERACRILDPVTRENEIWHMSEEAKYRETGNTEYLLDAGNYAMFEYMYPQHEKAHFRATDSSESADIVGLNVGEARRFEE